MRRHRGVASPIAWISFSWPHYARLLEKVQSSACKVLQMSNGKKKTTTKMELASKNAPLRVGQQLQKSDRFLFFSAHFLHSSLMGRFN